MWNNTTNHRATLVLVKQVMRMPPFCRSARDPWKTRGIFFIPSHFQWEPFSPFFLHFLHLVWINTTNLESTCFRVLEKLTFPEKFPDLWHSDGGVLCGRPPFNPLIVTRQLLALRFRKSFLHNQISAHAQDSPWFWFDLGGVSVTRLDPNMSKSTYKSADRLRFLYEAQPRWFFGSDFWEPERVSFPVGESYRSNPFGKPETI